MTPYTSLFRRELRALVSLTWPLLIAQITQTLMGVSDTIMAGRYSYTDMAAVAIGVSVTMPILIFIQGMSLALSPIVSRLHGAEQHNFIAAQTQQSIYLTLGVSLLALCLLPWVGNIFLLIDMQDEVRTISQQYVQAVLFGMPAFAVYQSLRNCCEGVSKTRPTMAIMGIGLLINIPANYVLINGLFGLPEMGGAGCGVATSLVFYSMALATIIYVKFAPSMQIYQTLVDVCKPQFTLIKIQFSQGLPIALTFLFEVSLFAVVAILLAPYGAEVVAAHQIALNFSTLMFMFPMSIGIAVAIRIGFHLGKQRADLAKISVNCGLACSIIVATCTASLSLLASVPIASLYSNDQGVIALASSLFVFAALFQFSDGIQVVSANALRGYKDSKAMFMISFVSYWLIGLPVGVVLGLTDWWGPAMAAKGFWIGFISGLTAAAIFMFARLKYIQYKDIYAVRSVA